MIRLQQRDWNILKDLGKCGLMSYSQIKKLYFNSYDSCYQRVSKLIRDEYIKGGYYNTDEKIFSITKCGIEILNDRLGIEYRIAEYNQVTHKLMRSECYCSIKRLGINEWTNEAMINYDGFKAIFDASFELDGNLYLVEVHNEQKTKILREKLNNCLKLNKIKFCLIIYCKNKDIVNNLLEKMNKKGFDKMRRYDIKIFEFNEEVML